MTPNHADDAPTLIDRALGGPTGQACIAKARARLLDDVRQNRFNSARAAEVYASGIDAAVWAYLGASPLRRIIYRNHLLNQERTEMASQLARAFVRETGAVNRPQQQRWFRIAS